jgi:hypothetical protein
MWSTSSSSNFLNFNRNSIIEEGNDASEPLFHGVNSAFDDYYVLYEDRPVQHGGDSMFSWQFHVFIANTVGVFFGVIDERHMYL